ncbi:Glycosyl hydrolase family 3 N-terminal domain protein [Streptomyces graminofaciens]|uniref:beta-glucosidase n=1 Tax=Streptomyces graminofaciens TaxID=68212 RepID=A0ABM7F9Q1_9ACTN|nr:glycoside hydrolase family 3 N-terminal domain-containing protein [Streptomyces graminofaciens]BBC32716.1 Glycosyl hydrolase family 3 N-terminal domain protein [Streptomyces graminofaciens]
MRSSPESPTRSSRSPRPAGPRAGGRRTSLLVSAVLLTGLLPLPFAAPATAARPATVTTDATLYPVTEGDTARIRVTVTGEVTQPVTVAHETATDADHTATTGTLTFPPGTPSGTTRTIAVRALPDAKPETAETIPVGLTVTGATPPAETPTVVIAAHGLPYLDPGLPVRRRVADLLSRMTLEEKAGQMTQAERGALATPADITAYGLGSLLSGGGSTPTPNTPEGWARMIDGFQLRAMSTRLQIPLIYAVDAVHGHNNLTGATITPHNIGLGAARDPQLAHDMGALTAAETRATGVPWDFAPCLCVTRDDRWGRAYESFGEDPALVKSMETIVQGLQGARDGRDLDRNDKVLATAKHFVGDGGTAYGSSTTGTYAIDQGITKVTRQELEAVHLAPYQEAVDRGVGSVMPSYSSLDILGDGRGAVRMHARADLINGVLKDRMGFDGFVVSDWQAIDQIPGDHASDVRTSVGAGLDMIMVPYAYGDFHRTLVAEVRAGRISERRVDDAVTRILTQKFRLGLFEKPYADTGGIADIGSPAHRAAAREAVAKSQVLLKNAGGLLPLRKSQKVYVAGSDADDLGNQSGGWTITWQGSSGAITEGTTVLEGLRETGAEITHSAAASAPTAGHDVGVVVVGETPYAEGFGDVGNGHDLELSAADKAAVDRVCGAMKCAVLIVSGRPQLIGDRLADIDALVASWLPGTEGDGVADVLYGRRPFTGRLPVTWPKSEAQLPINVGDTAYDPQFPYGWGLTTKASTGEHADATHGAAHALVTEARLRVQEKVGQDVRMTEAVAKPFAAAEHLLLTGRYAQALAKLGEAYRAA